MTAAFDDFLRALEEDRQDRRRRSLPVVMGILNVTPDSFSDGGRFADLDRAVEHARRMIADGATVIDVGGESTRPGAAPVDEAEELRRVVPVIRALRAECDGVLSVDTMKPVVMREACRAGAELINDVNALRADGAIEVARATGAAVCLMHMRGEPRTMQAMLPAYGDVVGEVLDFLQSRRDACLAAGISASRLLVDPGIGFGKTLQHNLALLAATKRLAQLAPVLIGVSRKSMFAKLLGRAVDERLPASLAATLFAVEQGASVVRTHDVRATMDALNVVQAIRENE